MIAHLDLVSGISGDMFLGALVDAGAPLETMAEAVRRVGGERLDLRAARVTRAGIRGTRVEVLLDGEVIEEAGGPGEGGSGHPEPEAVRDREPRRDHDHTPYSRLRLLIENAEVAGSVRERSLRVFHLLGEAEAEVHGVSLEDVHLHEVGSLDAVADVVGTVAGLEALGIERLTHGPVAMGGGRVGAAHGTLPVPAPATLWLLRGRPCVFEPEAGELTTPTGAALLAGLAEPADTGVSMAPREIGYGAGRQDPQGRPNLVRLSLGEPFPRAPRRTGVSVVEAALDDCTPEEGGHVVETLFREGALDVTLTPTIMKKGRPGFLVRIVTRPEEGAAFADRLVRLSPTLGARWRLEERLELDRRIDRVQLADGEVRVKVAILPDGSERIHPEYEDMAGISRRRSCSLARVREEVEQVWRAGR